MARNPWAWAFLLVGLSSEAVLADEPTEQYARASVSFEPDRRPMGYQRTAEAAELEVAVFDRIRSGRRMIGLIQRGTSVAIRPVTGVSRREAQCFDYDVSGTWLETPGGYVCSSGLHMGTRNLQKRLPPPRPDRSSALPFTYVKAKEFGSTRYRRVPKYGRPSVAETMSKAFFLAFAEAEEIQGINYVRTAYGEYVLAEDVRPVIPTGLEGSKIRASTELPLAFVVPEEKTSTFFCRDEETALRACGPARRYERFTVQSYLATSTEEYIQVSDGRLLPRQEVRMAHRIRRPPDVPPDARWVHFDLDEQAFVAYEGDRPVYASLVSTGVKGRDTPTGLYRTQRKYLTKTMTGPDEDQGKYRVEEIPWVMYYYEKYAVHGAYWHDTFGNVRSHGCTNVAPKDARWLFEWGPGRIPRNWLANLDVEAGTYFYFTRRSEGP